MRVAGLNGLRAVRRRQSARLCESAEPAAQVHPAARGDKGEPPAPFFEKDKLVLLMVGFSTIGYGFISPIISPLLGLPVTARLLATAVIIAPLGFLMGMPFPLGIRILSDSKKPLIPWAWAVNGCASVLGSILPTILALYLGFSRIFIIAGVTYLASLWMVVIHTNKVPAERI